MREIRKTIAGHILKTTGIVVAIILFLLILLLARMLDTRLRDGSPRTWQEIEESSVVQESYETKGESKVDNNRSKDESFNDDAEDFVDKETTEESSSQVMEESAAAESESIVEVPEESQDKPDGAQGNWGVPVWN